MGKYNEWNEKQLLQYYNELIDRYVKSGNTDIEAIRDASTIEELLKGPVRPFNLKETVKGRISEDRFTLLQNEKFMPDIESFKRISHLIKNPGDLIVRDVHISKSILLSFTHDFYNSLDPVFAKHFNHFFKERKTNLMFTDGVNTSTDRIKLREGYNDYPFNEMLPILMEMIALDFIEDKLDQIDEDCRKVRISRMRTISRYARELSNEYKYITSVDTTKKTRHMVSDLATTANISVKHAQRLLSNSAKEKLAYVIPSILDIELYYLYQFDREKFADVVMRLINAESDDYRKYIKDTGIILNQHSKQYVKEIKRGTNI